MADTDLYLLAVAPIFSDDGYVTICEQSDGAKVLTRCAQPFIEVDPSFLIEKIKEYELAIRMSLRLLTIAGSSHESSSTESLRWMCTECQNEGHGTHPDFCPNCGGTDGWHMSKMHITDPRRMSEIFDELFDPRDSETH